MSENRELESRVTELYQNEVEYFENIDRIIRYIEFISDVLEQPEDFVHMDENETSISPVKLPQLVSNMKPILIKSLNYLMVNIKYHRTFSLNLQQVVKNPTELHQLFLSNKEELTRNYSRYCYYLPMAENIINRRKEFFDKVTNNKTINIECSLIEVLHKPLTICLKYSMYFEELLKLSKKNKMQDNIFLYGECRNIVKQILQSVENNERWKKVINSETTFKDGSLLKTGEVIIKQPKGPSLAGYIFLFELCLYICKDNSIDQYTPSYTILEKFSLHEINIPTRMTEKDIKISKKDSDVEIRISCDDGDSLIQSIIRLLQRQNKIVQSLISVS